MPSCNTYRLTWVSLTLGVGYLFTAAPAKPLLLTLDEGYLLTAALPGLQCGIAPLGPPAPASQHCLVELKWTGMGEFNSDDHYIYYCGQESLRRNGVAIMVNKRV